MSAVKQAQTIAAVLFEDSAAVGPMKSVLGEWLVREAMKLWPRFAGLSFFRRTSAARRFNIVTYHHPARLCWSWGLSVTFEKHGSYAWPYMFGYRRNGSWAVRLPWLLEVHWSRQSYDWMLSGNARQRLLHIVNTQLPGGHHAD